MLGVIRIQIVDDHPLVRDALRTILNCEPDMMVVGECGDGRSAVDLALRDRPDVVLMDLRMPRMNGAAAATMILQHRPESRILLLTAFDFDDDIQVAMRAGALGYVWKDSPKAELLFAIREVAQGRRHILFLTSHADDGNEDT